MCERSFTLSVKKLGLDKLIDPRPSARTDGLKESLLGEPGFDRVTVIEADGEFRSVGRLFEGLSFQAEGMDLVLTFRMRTAYDDILADGLKRRHSVQQIIAALLKAEIADKPSSMYCWKRARSADGSAAGMENPPELRRNHNSQRLGRPSIQHSKSTL